MTKDEKYKAITTYYFSNMTSVTMSYLNQNYIVNYGISIGNLFWLDNNDILIINDELFDSNMIVNISLDCYKYLRFFANFVKKEIGVESGGYVLEIQFSNYKTNKNVFI